MVGPGCVWYIIVYMVRLYCITAFANNLAICATQQLSVAIVQSQMAILASVWGIPEIGRGIVSTLLMTSV